MTTVPVAIPARPYAICPPTNLMTPDGFFVVNMGPQFIQADIRNEAGGALPNVRVYVEGISDPGVVLSPEVRAVGTVPAGSSFPARFLASFRDAAPGVAYVSFIIESDGFEFRRVIKKVFVTRIDYNKASKTYSVVMPQGTMRVRIHKAIVGPHEAYCRKDAPFVALPTDLTYEWVPNPPYAGTHGPLPYEDPWWKIALLILALFLLAGALLYDYFSDGELDGGMVSVSGTFDETDPSVSCCSSVSTSAHGDDWIEKGLYGSVGAAITAAAASDGPDIHYRGQAATPPATATERTVSESVRLKIAYPVAPSPGRRFPVEATWAYERKTTTASYSHGATDRRENLHLLKSYEVQAPAIHDRRKGPLRVCARFQKPDGSYFKDGELYVSAVLVSTYGATRRFELRDDGLGLDEKPSDGWYCGGYTFRSYEGHVTAFVPSDKYDMPGDWYLFVFAQDVNTVKDGTKPLEAAETIGGFVLTTQLEMSFDQPCQLNHDAVIHVV